MKEKIKCLICGEQTNYVIDNFSACHLKVKHPEIKGPKDYYDRFFLKEGEGFCLVCGKETKFCGMIRGYKKYCSCKCSKQDPKVKLKLSQNKKELYSDPKRKAQALSRLKKTSLQRYGSESYVGSEIGQSVIKKSNLEKYGVEQTLQLEHVKAARNKALTERMEEINEKRKAFWTEENIKIVNENRNKSVFEKYGVYNVTSLDWVKEKVVESQLKTCQDRYGVDNVMQVNLVKERVCKTNLERYGFKYPTQSKIIKDKIRKTNEENDFWVPLSEYSEYRLFCRNVWIETSRQIKKLFSNWDGLDYYTNDKLISNEEFVKLNKDKHVNSNLYQPTIDHKISVSFGYINSIDPKVIGGLDNLCVCGRQTNSCKNYLCEDEFKEILKERLSNV